MQLKIISGPLNNKQALEAECDRWSAKVQPSRVIMSTAVNKTELIITLLYEKTAPGRLTVPAVESTAKTLLLSEEPAQSILPRHVPENIRYGMDTIAFREAKKKLPTINELARIPQENLHVRLRGMGHKKVAVLVRCLEYCGLRSGMTDAEINVIINS